MGNHHFAIPLLNTYHLCLYLIFCYLWAPPMVHLSPSNGIRQVYIDSMLRRRELDEVSCQNCGFQPPKMVHKTVRSGWFGRFKRWKLVSLRELKIRASESLGLVAWRKNVNKCKKSIPLVKAGPDPAFSVRICLTTHVFPTRFTIFMSKYSQSQIWNASNVACSDGW